MTSVPHFAVLGRDRDADLSRLLLQEDDDDGLAAPPAPIRLNAHDVRRERSPTSSSRRSIPAKTAEDATSQTQRYERAVSKSYIHPHRNLSDYEYYVVDLDDELEKRSRTDKKLWKRCRFTLNEDGITFSKLVPGEGSSVVAATDREAASSSSSSVLPPTPPPPSSPTTKQIPNTMIKTLKQTSTSGDIDSFTIVTKEGKEYVLRSPSKDIMTNWIFELQKVVARAITSQLSGQDSSSRSPSQDLEVKGTKIATSHSPRGFSGKKMFSQGCRSPERVKQFFSSNYESSFPGESSEFDGDFEGFSLEKDRQSSCSSAGGGDCFDMEDFPAEIEYAGVHGEQGDRRSMEDTHIVIDFLGSYAEEQQWPQSYVDLCKSHSPHQVFCVFDGHSGSRASEFMEREFVRALVYSPAFKHNPKAAITECFDKLDKQFVEEAAKHQWNDGCTAMVVIRRGDQLFWGHIGDCRAVVGRQMKNGSVQAVALNKEHNCGLPEEANRVRAAGGWFKEEKEWFVDRFQPLFGSNPDLQGVVSLGNHWKTLYRLNDEITVSRAIGDYFCKGKDNMDKFDWLYPTGHSQQFSAEFDLVVSVPEVGVYDIPTNFDDENRVFMILACDGLWDVVSNDLAASFVSLKVREGSFQECSVELVRLALQLGSLDNVSVIVVPLASDN